MIFQNGGRLVIGPNTTVNVPTTIASGAVDNGCIFFTLLFIINY